MRLGTGFALCALAAVLGGCGGGGDGGGSGVCNPGGSATMTIRSTGVTPSAVCVLPNGGAVNFSNLDTVEHTLQSGDCAELNLTIPASQSRIARFAAPDTRTCTFRDSVNPANTAFQGTVAVTTAPATGPGY